MKASANCFDVIKHFEGCQLRSYPDPKTGGAPWTCGWGATGNEIGPGITWTQQRADARLVSDVSLREADANNAIRVPVTQGRFDGFVSILFNVGHGSPLKDGIVRLKSGYPSTLLSKLNAGDFVGAGDQFARWVSPGSNVENGLRIRRVAERALFDGATAAEAIALAVNHASN